MSKIINNIEQLSDGGNNPKSGIYESTLWKLNFDDNSEPRILGRTKMLEYLSKGTVPAKTVHAFKKWEITTASGTRIRTWIIVYDDKSHTQLVNKDFYSLLTNGHKNKDEEKVEELSESLEVAENTEGSRGLVSAAVKQVQEQAEINRPTKSITTPEEKEQLDEFRKRVRENPFGESNS